MPKKKSGENKNGILLLDKPHGWTSNAILQSVKRLFNANKVGHTGSLDPLATGMLPLCFGESAKFSRFLLEANKCYQATIRLGFMTNTGDSLGEILGTKPVPHLTEMLLKSLLLKFQGASLQIPPMYSALKQNGQPLYRLAREGKVVERKAREIHIYQLEIDSIEENESSFITFTVSCSKGTYIRTLAEDMGQFLGTYAHVVHLRRLWVAPFQNLSMVTLDALEKLFPHSREKMLIPTEQVLNLFFPVIQIDLPAASLLLKGQSVRSLSEEITQGWVIITTTTGQFLGMGEMNGMGDIAPRRLIQEKSAFNVV